MRYLSDWSLETPATAFVPKASALEPKELVLSPIALDPLSFVRELVPVAIEFSPDALACEPVAIDFLPVALEPSP